MRMEARYHRGRERDREIKMDVELQKRQIRDSELGIERSKKRRG